MPKILVFGSTGLLGSHLCSLYKDEVIPISRRDCDITNYYQVGELIYKYSPDVVINCAGLTNKKSPEMDHIKINAYAPKIIAKACDDNGARMIQVSTDCVFNGDRGHYTEDDYPSPVDAYGYAKATGEVLHGNHLTVRCSFVGYPDPKRRSLLGWFEKQHGQVTGWSQAFWNGITTVELAHILFKEATEYRDHVFNLVHAFGEETLSKYEMLKTVNDVYGWGKVIVPDPVLQVNRTLDTIFADGTTIVKKPFRQMIEEMKEFKFGY